MNINSIHAYDGIKGNNRQYNESKKNNKVLHPISLKDDLSFQCASKTSLFERVMTWFKNPNLSFLGEWKEKIESLGFFMIFIIQDMLGMTLPRTLTGLNRDKEITGKLHWQEGKEVLGREGITGPAMMAIPAAVFATTAFAMGASTKTNSRLIRTLGNSFKNIVKNVTGEIKPNEIKAAFYESNIKQIFKDTGVTADDTVLKLIKDKFAALEKIKGLRASGERKAYSVAELENEFGFGLDKLKVLLKNDSLKQDTQFTEGQASKIYKLMEKDLLKDIPSTLQTKIDDALLDLKDADLSKLGQVKFDGNSYKVSDATDAMIRYAEDIVNRNKKLAEMNEEKAESFMNSLLGKRCVSNLSAIAAVLRIMNYLPRLYARSNTPPGETSKAMAREKCNVAPENQKADVAFTGMFSSLGKRISRFGNTTLEQGEFNGINFTPTLMTGISILGLTYPRAKRAYDRAPEKTEEQRMNEGWFSRMFKKDASEIKEIAVRDPISALAVTFAVPLLTRWIVKGIEATSGFVLINHVNEGSGFSKFMKYLNPYSGIDVLGNAELNSLYGKIDSHARLVNVCEYLSRKGGDLEKIFAKAENGSAIFNESTFTLESIKKLAVSEKNEKILNLIKEAKPEKHQLFLDSLLPATKKMVNNKALRVAKTFNSLPFFLNLVVISPFLLGSLIPKYTYKLTRNANSAKELAQQPQPLPNEDKENKKLELQKA